jgi:hypothetical protein
MSKRPDDDISGELVELIGYDDMELATEVLTRRWEVSRMVCILAKLCITQWMYAELIRPRQPEAKWAGRKLNKSWRNDSG